MIHDPTNLESSLFKIYFKLDDYCFANFLKDCQDCEESDLCIILCITRIFLNQLRVRVVYIHSF